MKQITPFTVSRVASVTLFFYLLVASFLFLSVVAQAQVFINASKPSQISATDSIGLGLIKKWVTETQNTTGAPAASQLPKGATPLKSDMSVNSLIGQNLLSGFTLLDDFQTDSLSPGKWTWWQNWPCPPAKYTSSMISTPFPLPADGVALKVLNNGSTYPEVTVGGWLRTINLGRTYLPGSRLGFYANFLRYYPGGYYDSAAIMVMPVPPGVPEYPNAVGPFKLVGSDGGYCQAAWPYIVVPNGFSGWFELPLDFVTRPFDRLTFWTYNYALDPDTNHTIIDHIMIKGITSLEVISVTAIPNILWLDKTGAGSGIVFKATTTEATTVNFKVITPTGQEIPIGAKETIPSDSEHVAKLSWWGSPTLATGVYTIIAEAGGNSKQNIFTVEKIDQMVVGMGTWMTHTKDPGVTVPPRPEVSLCPTKTWEELINEKEGYTSGISLSDPVNAVSGNFALPEEDLTIKSRFPLVLARIYNSLDPNIGPFGRGWSSPFLTHLEFLANDVVFINSDGSRILFEKTGNTFKIYGGGELRLVFDPNTGFWSVSHPSGSEWVFNTGGKIIRMSRACCGMGATDGLLFDYDSNGRLTRVTNPASQYIQFSYNADNRIISAADSTGRTLHYSYSSDGNLVSFSNVMGQMTVYEYNEDGFMTFVTKPGNHTTNVTYVDRRVSVVRNPDGTISQFTWDYTNRKLSLTDLNGAVHEYGFDNNWRFNSYAVPAMGIAKSFVSSGSAVTGYTNALSHSSNYVYGPDGLVRSIKDVMGNTTSYEWHPTFHRLTKKTDSLNREWQYSWDSRGNLQSEIDPAGGIASFGYDSHNNRISKTDQLGRITRWVYGNSGNYLVQTIDAEGGISSYSYDIRGNLISSSDWLGRTTLFSYDALDRLVKTTFPDGRFSEIVYDNAGNVSIRRDNLGRETRYLYDLASKLTMLTRPDGTTLNYAYNPAGQKISETDTLGRITRFEYSPLGLLTRTIYPDGGSETFTYDVENRLTSKTNELGHTINLQYNALGQLVATIDPTGARWESQYDSAGRKTADKDPYNRVTAYQFDNLDRITKVIRPNNSFTTSSFDAIGNMVNAVDALGNRWSWVYDKLNRQIKSVQPSGASSTTTFDAAGQVIAETDALGRTTRHDFDSGGRRTATIDTLNNVWRNFYDGAGRLIATKNPLNAVSSINYDVMDRVISQVDPLGNITKFEFDRAGRRVARVDALNKRSITVYDLRDRVTSELDPEGRMVSYGYNLAGQRVRVNDGANRIWRWEYDALGRVTAEIDPLGNAKRTRYDAVGNAISVTNARNQVTNFLFDSMNRNYRIAYPDGTVATMAFDLESRELVRSSQNGLTTKTYDSIGNLTAETFLVGSDVPGRPFSKTWRYSFDLVGNRIQAVDPEGQVYKYKLDGLNRLLELNPPKKGDEVKFAFDMAGRLVQETRPGVKTTNTFDLAGRLLQVKHERDRGHDKTVALRRYTYSPVGNRLTMTNEENCTDSYFYDKSDWLTRVKYSNGVQVSYTFNGAGDRLTEKTETPTVKRVGRNVVKATDTVIIPFGYDGGGRMTSRGSDAFVFDTDGNQIKTVENGDETRYLWNSDNRLVKVEKDVDCPKHKRKRCRLCPQTLTLAESYTYEPNSWRRLTRTVVEPAIGRHAAIEKKFLSVYDGDDEALEYFVTPKVVARDWKFGPWCWKPNLPKLILFREFIGGPGTDDIVSTRYHGRDLWMLTDALGSTIALTNRGGHAIARIGYDVFGNLKFPNKPGHENPPCDDDTLHDWLDRFDFGRSFGYSHDGWLWGRHHGVRLTPLLFASRRLDSFTGNYFNRNRYYQPKVGRFITKDPIGFRGGRNLWVYVNNNPMIFIDPLGLTKVTDIIAAYITGPSQKWDMKADDEYTGRMRSWGEVINAVNDAKSVLESQCKVWEKLYMSDSTWTTNMVPNYPNGYPEQIYSPPEFTPKVTIGDYWEFLKTNKVPDRLWYSAVGSCYLRVSLDKIDCECKTATLRFTLYNPMERSSFGEDLSKEFPFSLAKHASQHMWWTWTEDHSWGVGSTNTGTGKKPTGSGGKWGW